MTRAKRQPKNERPEWRSMNERARLEELLSGVVEHEQVAEERQNQEAAEEQYIISSFQERVLVNNPLHDVDIALVKKYVRQTRAGRVSIRHEAHQTSAYVLPVVRQVRVEKDQRREPIMTEIDQWSAPYDAPMSLDVLAAAAADLVSVRPDPHWYVEQFTPGDAHTAYHEQYRWWNRLRSPFIRWETVDLGETATKQPTQTVEERVMDTLEVVEHKVEDAVEELREDLEQVVTGAEQAWGAPVLVPRIAPLRVVAGFLGLAMIVSLPAGAVSLGHSLASSWVEIEQKSQTAIHEVKAMEWENAAISLADSDRALNRVNLLAVAVSKALPKTRDTYASARAMIAAGEKAVEAAGVLTKGGEKALTANVRYPVERIRLIETYLESAAPLIEDAVASMARVNVESLPQNVQAKATEARELLSQIQAGVREMRAIVAFAGVMVGEESQRRYLIVFQNPAELRPTGGFMGSYAEVLFDRGEIKSLVVPGGGPYDLQSQLKTRVRAPAPLRLIADKWEFQDANWFPDFAASAKKINWFWSKAGQPTLDGILAINARLVVNLLQITGPIDMPDYGKTITAENFMKEAQLAVEVEYDRKENKPKKFIGDLMAELMKRMSAASKEDWLAMARLGTNALVEKDIQVWFTREEEQALSDRYSWSSRLKPFAGDSLAIINTNIAGQKSDLMIDEEVEHTARVESDGSITDKVIITRRHKGQKGQQFHGANNVTYLRVYVPQGSELLNASGFMPPADDLFDAPLPTDPEDEDIVAIEQKPKLGASNVRITEEFNRTVFGGWIQLEPGQESITTFEYKLPYTVNEIATRMGEAVGIASVDRRPIYALQLTSQSGKPERRIKTSVQLPSDWQVNWSNNKSNQIGYDGYWNRDTVVAAILQAP